MSTTLNDLRTIWTSPVKHAVCRSPYGSRYGYHRADNAEGETRHRRYGAAPGTCADGGRQDGARVKRTARAVGEPILGAVPRAAMAVTVFGPGGGAAGEVDNLLHTYAASPTTDDIPVFLVGDAASCGHVGDRG